LEFAHVPAECAAEHEAPAPGIVLFRNFEEPKHIYTGPAEPPALEKFVNGLKTPLVFEFSQEHIGAIFDEQKPTLIYYNDNTLVPSFKEAALANKGKCLFSYSGIEDEF